MEVVMTENQQHLCLFATKDIKKDEEIICDYGDNEYSWVNTRGKLNSIKKI